MSLYTFVAWTKGEAALVFAWNRGEEAGYLITEFFMGDKSAISKVYADPAWFDRVRGKEELSLDEMRRLADLKVLADEFGINLSTIDFDTVTKIPRAQERQWVKDLKDRNLQRYLQ